jgi:hypothetical protein
VKLGVVLYILIQHKVIPFSTSIVVFLLNAKLLVVEHYIFETTPISILLALALKTTKLASMEMISMLIPLPVSTRS